MGQILTPVVLKSEQVLRGDTKPGALRVVIRGGTIGCDSMDVDVAPTVEVGRRYVFVLADTFDADGKKLLDLPTMRFAWPVDANDVVATSDGAMSLTDLARIVTHASPSPTS